MRNGFRNGAFLRSANEYLDGGTDIKRMIIGQCINDADLRGNKDKEVDLRDVSQSSVKYYPRSN